MSKYACKHQKNHFFLKPNEAVLLFLSFSSLDSEPLDAELRRTPPVLEIRLFLPLQFDNEQISNILLGVYQEGMGFV